MIDCEECENYRCWDDGLGYWDILCDLGLWVSPDPYPEKCESFALDIPITPDT